MLNKYILSIVYLFLLSSSAIAYSQEETLSRQVVYHVQAGHLKEAVDLYLQTYKKSGNHNTELLQNMGLLLIDQGWRSGDLETQVMALFGAGITPGAIARLDDMNIAPFLISSSLILSCAQRLMRRICSHCKEPLNYPAKMYSDLGIDPTMFDGVQLFRGRGCDRCKNSGYAGRMAIIEVMTISDEIRKLVISRASTREMGKVAISQGMRTLRMVALDRARAGISTLEQVLVTTAQH